MRWLLLVHVFYSSLFVNSPHACAFYTSLRDLTLPFSCCPFLNLLMFEFIKIYVVVFFLLEKSETFLSESFTAPHNPFFKKNKGESEETKKTREMAIGIWNAILLLDSLFGLTKALSKKSLLKKTQLLPFLCSIMVLIWFWLALQVVNKREVS